MIVVSDTSPLNYLVLAEAVGVLPQLFDRVLIPPTVLAELNRPRTPAAVRAWAASPPAWVEVRAPQHIESLPGLHAGETEAIALAEELRAERLLIDERDGANAARRRGLHVVGTLAVLGEAGRRGLIDLPSTILRLRSTNFRAPEELVQELLRCNDKAK